MSEQQVVDLTIIAIGTLTLPTLVGIVQLFRGWMRRRVRNEIEAALRRYHGGRDGI